MKKIILLFIILIPILGFGQFGQNSAVFTTIQKDSVMSMVNPLSADKTLTTTIKNNLISQGLGQDSILGYNPTNKAYKRFSKNEFITDLSGYLPVSTFINDLRNNTYLKGNVEWDGAKYIGGLFDIQFQAMPDGAFYEIYFVGNNELNTVIEFVLDGTVFALKRYLDGSLVDVPNDAFIQNGWRKITLDKLNGFAIVDLGSFSLPPHVHDISNITNLQSNLDAKQPIGTYATGTGSATGVNTGDNAANTTYANDYRLANFIAGTNYLVPNGNGSALTGITQSQVANLSTDLAGKQATITGSEAVFNGWDKDASNDFSGAYSALTGIPTTFTPATHTHTISDVTGLQSAIDGKQSTLVSATNIKTINGNSILGSGDLAINGISQTVLNDTSIAIRNGLNLKLSASDTSTNYKVMTRAKTDALYVPTRSFVTGGSVNSTTTQAGMLQSDFAVVTGGRYRFKYQIRYSSAATTTGAAFALFGNADVISASIIQTNANSTTSLAQSFSGTIAAVTPFITSTTSKLTNSIAIIEGEIVANANGFFQLYFASEVAASAITILSTSRKEFLRIE